MKESFLNEFLIDPLTGEQLFFDINSNSFRSPLSGNTFTLVDSIPCIIINNQSIIKPGIHQECNTNFNYGDHYQRDAVLFDYYENNVPGITKNELSRMRELIIREVSNDFSVVLDVGCGNGWVSKKLIPLGKKVISMDISSINAVNAIRGLTHINHAGLIADVYNIPLKENSMDCIIASEIMEHVPDPKAFIVSLVKLLKHNGKIIITVPYNEKIEYFLCVHCNNPTPKNAHLHSFNDDNIIQIIPQTGVTWSSKIFNNKYLFHIRSLIILKFLPFSIWIFIDNMFNRIFRNPTRLKIVIKKVL